MKDSDFAIDKRREIVSTLPSSLLLQKKSRKVVAKTASVSLTHLDIPLLSSATGCACESVRLDPDRPYTLGRARRSCDFVFDDCRVSKRHCQFLFDSVLRKVYILDGFLLFSISGLVVDEFRNRVVDFGELGNEEVEKVVECCGVRCSLNGIFINGFRVRKGMAMEVSAGDEVLLGCGNEGVCGGSRISVGFVVQRIVFEEEVVRRSDEDEFIRPQLCRRVASPGHSQGSVSSGKGSKRVFALPVKELLQSCDLFGSKCDDPFGRAKLLLNQCRDILHSDDPVSYLQQCNILDSGKKGTCSDTVKFRAGNEPKAKNVRPIVGIEAIPAVKISTDLGAGNCGVVLEANRDIADVHTQTNHIGHKEENGIVFANAIANDNPKVPLVESVYKDSTSQIHDGMQKKIGGNSCSPPGKKFYLNRLQSMDHALLGHHTLISLPELLHPIESISQIFIATFTSDISWFLSCCEIPTHLPVTIACHSADKCWSSSVDERTSMPYPAYPNLVAVYPPFPETIAFGADRKRQGIACHHPKLIVLQREDSLRVIVASANLVPNQWDNVTNNIWWQDFPCSSEPDYLSLFTQISYGEMNQASKSDFGAQLAGFVATLLVDVPSQTHWIAELIKYDFGDANAHLIASVPGVHSYRSPSVSESMHFLLAKESRTSGLKFLCSVEASVVGLSYLFRTASDTNGAQLKKLVAFIRNCQENSCGMIEVLLRRNRNVSIDANAVSVLVQNPDKHSVGECVQLGFLPRSIAKWVSPLWDAEFFRYSGYVCPKEALAAALGENNKKVQLILHVSQGNNFPHMSKMIQNEHVIALASLIASAQRCFGLWRLEEVVGRYRWPEYQETDFVYGASSIGSINAQFLAAFSAASGKRTPQFSESEDSDPEWGRWSTSQELKSPSIRIIFPTIERVKNAYNGVSSSRRILCFSEKTWQRLRTSNILQDAVPHPTSRIGYPMHTKVARRRFQSRTGAPSFGWVYCGSHNFSAAAWGRPISKSVGARGEGSEKTRSVLGSRLHILNYELGIIFLFPPPGRKEGSGEKRPDLDDIALPFLVPPPKYRPKDRPATKQAMREALAEAATAEEMIEEEILDEEEQAEEASEYIAGEKDEEKAYAEVLWSQVDSSQSQG